MKKALFIVFLILCLVVPISNISAYQATDLVQVLDDCTIGGLETWLKNAFTLVKYVGVALAIVLTAVDFIQVIGGSKDDDLKNAFNRTIKRLVAVILLLLTTVLITLIIDIVAPVQEIPNCVK